MAITVLDSKTALLLIDLQQGIVALPTAHPVESVIQHASSLARKFRSLGLPVVLTTVQGAPQGRTEQGYNLAQIPDGWADLVPELDLQTTDHQIVKRQWGAFTNTNLLVYLRLLSVTQVVIAGISTSIGVESTARHAHELGFNVTLAIDAMTDRNLDAHHHSITRIFPRLGETAATQEIVDLLRYSV